MVIGPTPPGTGVMAPATKARLVIGDVADQPLASVGENFPVRADIDDDGARLDPVAAHHFRLVRSAATRMSARRARSAGSRVCE